MKLQPIEKRAGLTREEFQEEYLKKNKPVVFKDLSAPWPATKKWTFEFFKENYGDLIVPLFSTKGYHDAGKGYMSSQKEMPFRDYLEIIEHEPTEWRMFLFNIFKHVPELLDDFSMPTITDGWVKSHPFMFFGGQGAHVNLHYDIDCSAVFLTQFQNRKKVILFGPDQSKYLYNHPYTVQSHVDIMNPDYEKYPALKMATGYETTIQDGETIFMPPMYWHYIYYTDGGFSLSLRSNNNMATRVKGLWNITRHFIVDKGMNQLLGEKWKNYKEQAAEKRAEMAMSES